MKILHSSVRRGAEFLSARCVLKNSSGYTLLEMAIVLIIIALLTGGIVVGRNLVEQSIKRAVLAEMDKYIKAVRLFSDRYNQLPGDINRAEALWGSDTVNGCPGVFSAGTVPQTPTCNGDGNGTIGSFDGTNFTHTTEWYRAWQHMANAGVIDGQYSGVGGNATSDLLLGKSVPKSAYAGGGYMLLFRYYNGTPASAEDFLFTGQHVLEFGAVDSGCAGGADTTSCITHGALLTPSDALEIDDKIDDGVPGTGVVMGRPSTSTLNPGCTTTANATTSQYNVSNTVAACGLIVGTGF